MKTLSRLTGLIATWKRGRIESAGNRVYWAVQAEARKLGLSEYAVARLAMAASKSAMKEMGR